MKITDQEVLHVAGLSRLKLDEHELKRFLRELNAIVDYMDMLAQIDTAGVAETVHATTLTRALRQDIPERSQERAAALANAPSQREGKIMVPRVIE